jgi:hypothetical protein
MSEIKTHEIRGQEFVSIEHVETLARELYLRGWHDRVGEETLDDLDKKVARNKADRYLNREYDL